MKSGIDYHLLRVVFDFIAFRPRIIDSSMGKKLNNISRGWVFKTTVV